MELQPHEDMDEQGNIVGPGYMLSPDKELRYFVSPSAMGYRVHDQLADEQRMGWKKPSESDSGEPRQN